MPAKSKQQQKFFGVVKAMQKGDIPKKGEAGEVAKDMKKKEVDKMASTKHKGLPKKIKEMIGKTIVKELQLNEVQPFADNQLRKKWSYPLGNKDGLVYLATNDKRYPTELVVYNIKRDMFHFMHSQMGKWSNPTQENVPADKLSSTHWVQDYFEEWKEDFDYEKGFKENKTVYGLEDPNAKVVNDLTEASANVLRSKYEKAIKKEQALSSLLLVNLEKYKAAKAKGDEKAIAKHTKIAGDIGKKKAKATADASAAYAAYENKISGLHSDAELELKEVDAKDNTEFTVTLKHLLKKHVSKGGEIDEMQMVNKKTGEDVTRHMIAYLEKKITKKEFEELTGLSKEKLKVSKSINEADFRPGDRFGGRDGDKDYKYKKYASKSFERINDAMFEFRHSMGIKTLTNKDMKLKKKVEALHQAIFDLQKEMKRDGLTEGKLNEMDINDPILVAIRARKTDLKKKAALPKVKKISTKQYYKLMDMESDIIDQMKDAAKEYQTLDSEMNQDAGQKGSNWTDADANRYGGDLNKLQTRIEKLAKQKAKVKKAIMNYRIN